MRIDRATRRAIASEADERAAHDGCFFSNAAADHAVDFIESLQHTVGQWAGDPVELLEWQSEKLIRPLFGWQTKDCRRRFRIAYVEIPKKNGKTTICSAIALYMLAGDGEAGAEVYVAAADKNQAGICYKHASDMAQQSPILGEYITPKDSIKHIALQSTRSLLRVVSRESYSAHGLNIHGLIFDELHAQKTRELWDALRYGGASRRQPLIISITTAGYDRNSICWEQHQRAKAVLEGRVYDQSFFPLVYGMDPEEIDDPVATALDPEVWKKTNPSLGMTIDREDFAREAEEAAENPRLLNSFLQLRLNVWTNQAVRLIPMDKWDDCDTDFDLDELEQEPCYCGIDLSSTTDMTSVVLVFPREDGELYVVPYFFFPEAKTRSRDRDVAVRKMIELWGREAIVTLTAGEVIDYDFIRARINELADKYDILEIAYDPWNAQQIATQLDEGDGLELVKFTQNAANYNEPIATLITKLIEGKIRHRGHPVLRWQAGNVAGRQNAAGHVMPDKEHSADKIDGICALLMAIGRTLVHGEAGSKYETEGLTIL